MFRFSILFIRDTLLLIHISKIAENFTLAIESKHNSGITETISTLQSTGNRTQISLELQSESTKRDTYEIEQLLQLQLLYLYKHNVFTFFFQMEMITRFTRKLYCQHSFYGSQTPKLIKRSGDSPKVLEVKNHQKYCENLARSSQNVPWANTFLSMDMD